MPRKSSKKVFYGKSVPEMIADAERTPAERTPAVQIRTVDATQDIGGVKYISHSVDGNLKSLTVQFTGGSGLQFYVEE